jgi:ribosomal protein S25
MASTHTRLADNWKFDLTVVKAAIRHLEETGLLTYYPEEGQIG